MFSLDAALLLQALVAMLSLSLIGLGAVMFGFPAPERPEEGQKSGAPIFSTEEMVAILAPYVVRKCLAGQRFAARDAWQEIPVLRDSQLTCCKSVGDCLGRGHLSCGPLNLYRLSGKIVPVRENGGRCWDRCAADQQQLIADDFGITTDGIVELIWALPSISPELESVDVVSDDSSVDSDEELNTDA